MLDEHEHDLKDSMNLARACLLILDFTVMVVFAVML